MNKDYKNFVENYFPLGNDTPAFVPIGRKGPSFLPKTPDIEYKYEIPEHYVRVPESLEVRKNRVDEFLKNIPEGIPDGYLHVSPEYYVAIENSLEANNSYKNWIVEVHGDMPKNLMFANHESKFHK